MSTTTDKATTTEDPYLWLEDVEAPECLEFAKKANDKCLQALGDPKEASSSSYQKILEVLESKDRIPHVTNYGFDDDGNRILFNLWKDQDHPKGIWRKTTLSEYKQESPKWETVLDIDALAKADDIGWVWKGSRSLPRKRDTGSTVNRVTRSLLSLSRGGSDAIHLKEFDLEQNEFVSKLGTEESAFELPEAKTRASYKSRNVLLVGSDFGEGSLTDSGYPRVVKEWVRGTSIEDAPTVFEGQKTDVAVNGYVCDERIWGGGLWQVHSRSITFYTSQYLMAKLTEQDTLAPSERTEESKPLEFVELQIPQDADMDLLGNMLIISLRSDWEIAADKQYKSGSVIYCDLETFLYHGPQAVQEYKVLFEPTERTAYEYFTCTKSYLILASMDNVKSKLEFYKIAEDGNSLALVGADPEPQIRSSSVRPVDSNDSDEFWFTTSDYITPSTLCWADARKIEDGSDKAESYVVESLKSLPPQFNSDGLIIEQKEATSADGTIIPYFIVRRKDIELNGKNPTLLYGYGGFEISLGPHYIATSGLAWLERGGVYVEANIRGGGEFGPSWHQAALKEKRQACYDDFIAVGEHLISQGICTPKTLAARGGSNGGKY
jgi:prolyl oligopeptidase